MQRIIFLIATVLFFSCGQSKNKEKEKPGPGDSVKTIVDTILSPEKPENPSAPLMDEAIVNGLLKSKLGDKWRVVTDADVTDRSHEYDDMIKKERKDNPGFPFIVKGDFNGDDKTDYGVLITNGEQEYSRLLTRVAVIPAEGKVEMFEESTMPITVIRIAKKSSTIEGFMNDKDKKILLKYDAVDITTGDAGGFYIYWDGKGFKMLYSEG